MTPTSRSLQWIKKHHPGWLAEKVEQRVPHCFITRDLFGFADLVALDDAAGLLAIQVTSGSHAANRRAKILGLPAARRWLERGLRCEVWSWSKTGPRGKAKRWTLKQQPVVLADFGAQKEAS